VSVLSRRWRGFRVINLFGLGLLVTLVLGVYLAKTIAWRERNEIAAVEQQIREQTLRIRLLEAEVAHLEQPRRLQVLSSGALGLEPISAEQEIILADLKRFARPQSDPRIARTAAVENPAVIVPATAAAPAQAVRITEQ
jgi:hypothetical protein